MSDITLRKKDYTSILKAIDINKNNVIDETEATTNLKGKPPTITQLAGALEKNKASIVKMGDESANNAAAYIADNFSPIIKNRDKNSNFIKFIDSDFDLNISKEEISQSLKDGTAVISKGINVNTDKKDKLEETFGKEQSQLINKFNKNESNPLYKEDKSSLFNAVIKNTSKIEDLESLKIFDKSNYSIAADILNSPQLKDKPELKQAIFGLMNKIPENDKNSLVAIEQIFKRKPELSDDQIKAVFNKINDMTNAKYVSEVGSSVELAMSALQDVAMPTNISQENIGTCAGTSVQIQFALRNPLEYLSMLDKLAKNETYTSLNGKDIKPNLTFTQEGIDDNKASNRTISAKLMQNTIMDYADSTERNYDSSKGDQGLNSYQTFKALNEIVNLTDIEQNDNLKMTPRQIIKSLIDSKPSWENPVEIGMSYAKTGRDARHSVNVIDINNKDVTIVNPWGRTETFPVEELERNIIHVINKTGSSPVNKNLDIKSPEVLKELEKLNPDQDIFTKLPVNKMYTYINNVAAFPDKNNNLSDKEKIVILNLLNEVLDLGAEQAKDQSAYNSLIVFNKMPLLHNLEMDNDLYKEVKSKIEAIDHFINAPREYFV